MINKPEKNQQNLPNYHVRKFQTGDKPGVISVLKAVFHYEWKDRKWHWLIEQNPCSSEILVAINQNGEVVGQQLQLNHFGTCHGKDCQVSYPAESCLLPDYRHYHYFLAQCLENYRARPDMLIWSFHDKRASDQYEQLVRSINTPPYAYIRTKIKQFRKNLASPNIAAPNDYSIEPITRQIDIKKEIDELWQKKKAEIKAGVCRDWRYLSWKENLLENSDRPDFLLIRSGNETVGYLSVSKIKSKKIISLNDLLILNRHFTPIAIKAIEDYCYRQGARRLSVVIKDLTAETALKSAGYRAFYRKYFNCYDKLDRIKTDDLYLTDSDILI